MKYSSKDKHYQNILYRYGVTEEKFNRMLEVQGGLCGICCEPMKPGKFTHVDHDHMTGEVCGLLCHNCNTAIGLLDHESWKLESAKEYLEESRHGG
jgi:hypothetical protein